jgi:uncharacterized membrane protein YozB (DUF420 family)
MAFDLSTPGGLNLVFQIGIFIVLFVSYAFKRRGKFVYHGATMLVAVVLNIISFFAVMLPSLLASSSTSYYGNLGIVSLSHGILGGIALILGIFLVAAWGLQRSVQSCVKRKMIMRVTISLWFLALILGFLLYAILYGIITL